MIIGNQKHFSSASNNKKKKDSEIVFIVLLFPNCPCYCFYYTAFITDSMFSMLIEAGTSSHAAPQSEHFYLFVLELKSFPQDAEKSTEK